MHTIKLKNDKEFSCNETTSILSAALEQGVALEYSCLSGRCRSCRVKVLEGEVKEIQEDIVLSKEEKEAGFVLSCIVTPCSDVKLDVEDLGVTLYKKQVLPAKINSVSFLSEDVVRVVLRLPPKQILQFIAGQYVDILYQGQKRSYSIANIPNNENTLEFLIRNYQGGFFSNYWFNSAKENDLLRIEGPLGTFFYRHKETSTDIVLLATGTGIAPIKALLAYFSENKNLIENKKIWLFWGGRQKKDIFLDIEQTNFELNYIPVLSKEEWEGEKGHIQNVALKQPITWQSAQVYACGSPNMIETSREILIKNGLQEDQFFADSFISTK